MRGPLNRGHLKIPMTGGPRGHEAGQRVAAVGGHLLLGRRGVPGGGRPRGHVAPGARVRSGGLRKTDSMHHHHPEGVAYRSFCLHSGTVAVSETASRRWWCIESLFPGLQLRAHLAATQKVAIQACACQICVFRVCARGELGDGHLNARMHQPSRQARHT